MKTLIIACVVALTGCASLKPDYVTAGYLHQSVPMRGKLPAPIGDNGDSVESNMDALEAGARWERGHWYGETTLAYHVRDSYMRGGSLSFMLRAGVKVKLP